MFKGGLKKLNLFKELSKNSPIENFPCGEQIAVALSQHTGFPAKPVVAKGDTVTAGQVIGEPAGFISGYIHSPVSGTVKGLENRALPTGKNSLSVVIDNDLKYTPYPEKKTIENWRNSNPDQIVDTVNKAGIAGLGGAAFPTFVKLKIPEGKKAEYVILNGCECEPFLTADYRVLKENTDEVLEGLAIICKTLRIKKAFIGIESNKQELLPFLKKSISLTYMSDKIEIKVLPVKYPQGSEKQLIKSITGMEVPSGGLPIDVGCVVFNVQTALSVKKAVCEGIPLTERVLTVTGLVKKPGNLRVKIGTPLSEILSHCGAEITESRKIIVGGPMMGVNIPSPDVPVIKSTTGIIVLPKECETQEGIAPCIRCGKCIEACPINLMPSELSRYAENKVWEMCARIDLSDCIECGCCSYVCPAKRPMVDLFKWAKAELRKQEKS